MSGRYPAPDPSMSPAPRWALTALPAIMEAVKKPATATSVRKGKWRPSISHPFLPGREHSTPPAASARTAATAEVCTTGDGAVTIDTDDGEIWRLATALSGTGQPRGGGRGAG